MTTTANATVPVEPRITDGDIAAIASELARIDGYDPEDEQGGLYHVVWSGQPPEPMGDVWNLEYMPKAKRIAKALGYHERALIAAAPQPEATQEVEQVARELWARELRAKGMVCEAVGVTYGPWDQKEDSAIRALVAALTRNPKSNAALVEASRRLVELVEGSAGHRFANQGGLRLKDTEAWVAFYCIVKDAERAALATHDAEKGGAE